MNGSFYSSRDTAVRLNGTKPESVYSESRKRNHLFRKLTARSKQKEATKTAAMFSVPHTLFFFIKLDSVIRGLC